MQGSVGQPAKDDSFVSWGNQSRNKIHLKHLITFYEQERNACLVTALGRGDTDYAKGQVAAFDQILNTFEFLADTLADTGVVPDTQADTAEEQ